MDSNILDIKIDTKTVQFVTTEQAWHYNIIPFKLTDSIVSYYHPENKDENEIFEELELFSRRKIEFHKVRSDIFIKALSKYYRKENTKNSGNKIIKESDDFLTNLIQDAKQLGSSDIHIEPYEESRRVRIRIDGVLVERYIIEKEDYPSIINKIKIMANLDISEKRLPQDGRIFFNKQNMKFDIRVSTLPTLYGEKIVLRLLSNDATNIELETLGFSKNDLENYMEGIKQHNGIVLISGPTGSGKTTTLYATLKLLNKESSNVVTIEDPIEYTLEGINQVQLKESIGLDFASALKTFLRQDPDVIMLGEIRDKETASMAIRASLTGHLVLSTIHTNSAWDTVSRLVDMGIPSYLIANTLRLSVAQRLVRVLCEKCKLKQDFDAALFPKSYICDIEILEHYVACGCDDCHQTGYKGRNALYEVLPIDSEISKSIRNNEPDISDFMKVKNIKSLSENAIILFAEGKTSLEEIYSILIN